MNPEQIDRVFGRGRLKMATGDHVDVYREAAAPGERRRYTKRFLNTRDGDFAQWTEREWRILARLIGHGIGCVPEVVQFDRGAPGGTQLVQTYDAGATVDQWATILPVERDGRVQRHVFEDCAHWWALAHHCLLALHQIHELQLVHLDIKGDNVCIPVGPAGFDPDVPGLPLHPLFEHLALIDFAFSLVSRESLPTALPIGWQKDYDYQSPRLLNALEAGRLGDLQPTRELDWRCDMYSLAAMLKRYLPDEDVVHDAARAAGWSPARYDAAKGLLLGIRDSHDRELAPRRPHQALIEIARARLCEPDLELSLRRGWTLARDADVTPVAASPLTPLTRLAPSIRIIVSPRVVDPPEAPDLAAPRTRQHPPATPRRARIAAAALGVALVGGGIAVATLAPVEVDFSGWKDDARSALAFARSAIDRLRGAEGAAPVLPAPQPSESLAAAGPEGERSEAQELPTQDPEPPPAAEDVPPAVESSQATPKAPAGAVPPAQPPSQSASAARGPVRARSNAPRAQPKQGHAAPGTAGARLAHSTPARPATVAGVQSSRTDARRGARPAAQLPVSAPPPSLALAVPRTSVPEPRSAPAAKAASEPPRVVSAAAPAAQASPVETARTATEARVAAALAEPMRSQATPLSRAEAPAQSPRAAAPPRRVDPRSPVAVHEGLLSSILRLGRADGKPAPIEERPTRSGSSANVAQPAAPNPVPSTDAHAAASPAQSGSVVVPPAAIAGTQVLAPRSFDAQAGPDAPPRSAGGAASADAAKPVAEPAPASADATSPQPFVRRPAPRATPPEELAPRPAGRFAEEASGDFAAQARRMLADSVPSVAARAQPGVSRVLWIAANAYDPWEGDAIVDAARQTWAGSHVPIAVAGTAPAAARQLDEAARHAYSARRDIVDVFDLQLRAFGANPADAEVAGNLAFIHLRLGPPQPETARKLAMHAIALSSAQRRPPRVEDWTTFAVASALTGRDDDARNALYVTVALARDLDRSCRSALNALASHGVPMRMPVKAMMLRIQSQGRDDESPYCTWPPPQWSARTRYD